MSQDSSTAIILREREDYEGLIERIKLLERQVDRLSDKKLEKDSRGSDKDKRPV